VVADKTGSLIATAARFGAMLGGADEATTDLLARFGERIGIAFQLSDDVLDVTSDSVDSGKTPGTDLREGIPTLPVLYVQRTSAASDTRLLELLAGPIENDADVAEALELLRAHPQVEAARAEVRRWAGESRAVLEPLPDTAVKRALDSLCDLVVDRTG
jgi:heptaprenyl diphosphate synthase